MDFDVTALKKCELKHVTGGHVPPPGEPGDTGDPSNPPPRPGNHSGYIDPNADNPITP